MNEPGEHAEHPPVAADIPLRCMQCDYSLTGLTTRRCPECGTPFDVAELRRLQNPEPQAVSTGLEIAVWWAVLRHPEAFARRFPAVPDRAEARWYSVYCYCLSLGILLLACLPLGPALVAAAPIGIVSIVGAMWLCEVTITLVLTSAVRPQGIVRRYQFWRGITHYTSGFSILSALWAAIAGVLVAVCVGRNELLVTLCFTIVLIAGMLVFAYWCFALGSMVQARSRPGLGRIVAWLAVPCCGVLSIFAGWFIAMAVLLLFFRGL